MRAMKPAKLPWRDYSGALSPLKAAVFLSLFVPAIWVFFAFEMGLLGPRPFNEAIHQIGLWTIRFLFIALAITPFRQGLQWPRLILVRRMLGVGAFAYGVLHLTLYTADQAFDLGKVASEIALRFYLTIGFVALIGLAALAVTSTDGMIKRMGGRRWQRLHRLVYPIGVLALIHHFLQSKLNVIEPLWMSGLFLWLMFYRLLWARRRGGRVPLWGLGALGLASGVLTGLGEAVYYHFKTGAPFELVALANFNLEAGLRPAWVVAGAAAAVFLAALARGLSLRIPRMRFRPT
jgi:methionine sulfoxide reductase heme-binding subunit